MRDESSAAMRRGFAMIDFKDLHLAQKAKSLMRWLAGWALGAVMIVLLMPLLIALAAAVTLFIYFYNPPMELDEPVGAAAG